MKKLDFNQVISAIANIGVIIGILFLAVEVRQYDEQLKSQSRFNYYDKRASLFMDYALSSELSGITIRYASGDDISQEEYFRLYALGTASFTLWEYEHGELAQGRISLEDYSIPTKRIAFHTQPLPYSDIWQTYSQSAPKSFVEFMEANIVNQE